MPKIYFLICFILWSKVNAKDKESFEFDTNQLTIISESVVVSIAGGFGGALAGAGIGGAVETASGRTCNGSDFCFPLWPVVGIGIGYPIGASWALYGMSHSFNSESKFYKALMWTIVGVGLGGVGAVSTSGSPIVATGIFIGMAHIFPAVMMSF